MNIISGYTTTKQQVQKGQEKCKEMYNVIPQCHFEVCNFNDEHLYIYLMAIEKEVVDGRSPLDICMFNQHQEDGEKIQDLLVNGGDLYTCKEEEEEGVFSIHRDSNILVPLLLINGALQ